MSDIQKARDVLAKWREYATPGPWSREEMPETGENRVVREFEFFGLQIEGVAPGGLGSEDARLIVGTAGNPELLDAIDAMFDYMTRLGRTVPTPLVRHLDHIAAALLAADERMSA